MRNAVILGVLLIGIVMISGCVQNTESTDLCSKVDCNDNNTCTTDSCTSGNCTYQNLTDTTSCGQNKECYRAKCVNADKCTSIYFRDKLTNTEIDEEINACYTGKYISYAVQEKDIQICDEIVVPAYLGMCYGNVAYETNYSVCEKVKVISYEAKGFYNNVTSKDVCYFFYSALKYDAFGKGSKDACEKIENEQSKKECMEFL